MPEPSSAQRNEVPPAANADGIAARARAATAARYLKDLNPEQRRAVEAVRGPVCILAWAGSGKTTTITRRVANQVATGAFTVGEILAVTFTDKAATEMREQIGWTAAVATTPSTAGAVPIPWWAASATTLTWSTTRAIR